MLHGEDLLFLPQLLQNRFVFRGDVVLLIAVILLLDPAKLLPDRLNAALNFIVLGLKALRAIDQEDGQASHPVSLIHQIQYSAEANDRRQSEAQEGLSILRGVHDLVLPRINLLVIYRADNRLYLLFLLMEELLQIKV